MVEKAEEDSKENSSLQITTENKNVALEQVKKNEVIEIKLEPVELYSEAFGVHEIIWGPTMKYDNHHGNIEGIVPNRINNEHNYAKQWIQCGVKNKEVVEMQLEEIKLEKELNIPKLEVTEITEELILKNDTDCDMLMDGIVCNRIKNQHNYAKEWIQCDVKKEEVVEMQLEEIKLEKELNIAKLEVTDITEELFLKNDTNCDTFIDKIVCNRINNEHNYAKQWIQCGVKNEEVVEMQLEEMKLVKELNIAKLEVTEITEELILKNDTDCDILMDGIVCNRISTECADTEEGATSTPTAVLTKIEKLFKIEEMDLERFMDREHCQDIDAAQFSHYHSNANAKPDILLESAVKRKIPGKLRHVICKKGSKKSFSCYNYCNYTAYHKHHLIRKHPNFIASVSSKIYKCPHCIYATISKSNLARHVMLKHTETAGSYQLSTCIHCNATFKTKFSLDDHIVRKHPNFIASVSSEIHKCPHCMYATISKSNLARHVMLKHTETARSYQLSTCIHCNATFTRNVNLDNHIVKIHPDFSASVSRKVYKCLHCTHATVWKTNLARHMKKHFKSARSYELITCTHCNATLKKKQSLDNHTVRKHPDLIASVSKKINKCTHCTNKTIYKNVITKHMLKHSEIADTHQLNTCIHCNLTFKSKQGLDDHVLKKHPNFIASVSSKIYKCLHCTYATTFKSTLDNHILRIHPDFIASVSSKIHKCPHCTSATTSKGSLARHMLKHLKTKSESTRKLITCTHCNARLKSKRILDDHIVRKHPDFIPSLSIKIYSCTHCTYKTIREYDLNRHMMSKHSATAGRFHTCLHCNVAFKCKQSLDEHTIKKHPDFIASVSRKIHACSQCRYKTIRKVDLAMHMLTHSDIVDSYKLNTCIHCNKTFTKRQNLDDHLVRKHPDLIALVSGKYMVVDTKDAN